MSSRITGEICGIQARRTQRGAISAYQVEVRHRGLNEVRTVTDRDHDVAVRKAKALLAKWDERWARMEQQAADRSQKLAGKDEAVARTDAAEANLTAAQTLLHSALGEVTDLDWNTLEDHRSFVFEGTGRFPAVQFDARGEPTGPIPLKEPVCPHETDTQFEPQLTWLDGLWSARRIRKERAAKALYETAFQRWKRDKAGVDVARESAGMQFTEAQSAFRSAEAAFTAAQGKVNADVAAFKKAYLSRSAEAVSHYCELVLGGDQYPDFFGPEFTVNYNPENGIAVVECEIPDKDTTPTILKVTYAPGSDEFKEKHSSDSDRDKLYDTMLYQTALRTIHTLFQADAVDALKSVVFNGWVDALNAATGKKAHGCLLSVQAGKQEFGVINLAKVDPKACFKQLKGVSASRLSGMTPIAPILQLQRDDPRFIVGQDVENQVTAGFNLATMDWEDFEHLVRQLFEAEFSREGAEVRVTRASADGGVDAVILDPDPLHGGKIVIQAKRYTNTVGVAAVRELYGTLINEGANRGILVSTADYGPDSYEFVKGKPITLLNGANLLHLLEKHGHKARIDLREAKIANSEAAKSHGA